MARKKKRKERGLNYLVLVPLVGLVFLLVFFNINLLNQRKITREQLSKIKEDYYRASEEKEHLQTEADDGDREEEIERIAREQLLLRKEGEEVIVISREEEDVGEEEEGEENDEEERGFFEKLTDILPWPG